MTRYRAALLVLFVSLGASCQSKSAKLQKCHATCDDLNREYRDQCTGPETEGCLENVERHHEACGRICDEESMQREE